MPAQFFAEIVPTGWRTWHDWGSFNGRHYGPHQAEEPQPAFIAKTRLERLISERPDSFDRSCPGVLKIGSQLHFDFKIVVFCFALVAEVAIDQVNASITRIFWNFNVVIMHYELM